MARICPPCGTCEIDIHERNILQIAIKGKQELIIDDYLVSINQEKDIFKVFLDNNGDKSCDYCQGQGLEESSDNPTKAVISLQVDNETHYNMFIQVQDELTKAYYELRAKYTK